MILVDANILLYAADSESPLPLARPAAWWDEQLSGPSPVCLCWPVSAAFMRIATNRRVFHCPLTLEDAAGRVQSWLDQPCVRVVHPTEKHWHIFRDMLHSAQAVANLVADAHLAALALEHGCQLNSTDGDFARFSKLAW